ncbi:MAG: serine hydrolase, partial [Proteobacteria bacterium]|nr:serine hydrolase [Pseudomonadota bacterium]
MTPWPPALRQVASSCRWTPALFGAAILFASYNGNSQTASVEPGYEIVESDNQSAYMRELPPRPDKIVDSDHSWALDPEKAKWSFQNVSKILPTDFVSRGTGPVLPLSYADTGVMHESFTAPDASKHPLREILHELGVDGFIFVKDSVVRVEAYYNGFTPDRRHIAFSVTKSLIGSLVGLLVHEGRIDLSQTVVHYLPELEGSGFADATIRQVLD